MGVRKGPQRCVLCLRSKEEAVKEQVAKGVGCGNPKCIFAEVIQQAIEDSQKAEESLLCVLLLAVTGFDLAICFSYNYNF